MRIVQCNGDEVSPNGNIISCWTCFAPPQMFNRDEPEREKRVYVTVKASDMGRFVSTSLWLKIVFFFIQGGFFNWPSPENVSRLPPPNLLGLALPKFSKCWSHIHFARHLDVFRSLGGPVWDSDDFFKSVTYRPTLSKFRGGPVKKTPCTTSSHRQWEKMGFCMHIDV